MPATLNPERTELAATFTDELLRESDLRCLTWSTTNPYSFPAVKFDARCSLACTLQVRGHVTTPGGKRIRGVRIRTDHTLSRADWRSITHSFRGAEEARRVKAALARHGRLRVAFRTQARDADGRRSAARRVVTLRGG